ncbi:MAG: lipopolysaccharide assembly protein LapB [Betaproteobacteria bacterium]|nr:lipopolysaccharide assembly protein LapB [Betaproteobacteria bacterium]
MADLAGWLPWLFVGALACFGLGWMAARVDIKQLIQESRAMPRAYFRGLNFLMNEEPDKAVEAFIDVSKAHPEAVELQFALGSLLRRRGEADRAIKIHQELMERSGLDAALRNTAALELARDFQKAGLLDHADEVLDGLLPKLAPESGLRREALVLLKDISVQAREWDHAVEAARLLLREFLPGDARLQAELAQFHCERAEDLKSKDPAAAERELDAALAANPACMRANMLRGDWHAADGRHAQALEAWRAIEAQDAQGMGLVAARMMQSWRALGQADAGVAELTRLQDRAPGLDVMKALLVFTRDTAGPDAALELARAQLKRHPTLVGLDRVYESQVNTQDDGEELALQKKVVHEHAEKLAMYLCSECGFKSRQHFWHCPACGQWESMPPRLTAELDTAGRHLFHATANAAPQAAP